MPPLSVSETAALRDQLYRLHPENRAFYEETRLFYITQSEGVCPCAYDDGKGFTTVGIGFNMDLPDARAAWQSVFGRSLCFDTVYQGRGTLAKKEMTALLHHGLICREEQLREIYKDIWGFLRPNERLAIESAYFNAPRTVNGSTRFWGHLHRYIQKKEIDGLKQAVIELKDFSNPEPANVRQGIQNRRNSEAEMLASFKCGGGG